MPSTTRRWITGLIVFLGLMVFLISSGIAGRMLHSNDFKHIYLGMQALVSGDEPYSPASLLLQARKHGLENAALNPFVYPPFTGLSLAFLAPLPFTAAVKIWFLLNMLITAASAWIISRSLFGETGGKSFGYRSWTAFGIILLAIGISHPYIRTLTAGQLTCVLLFCQSAAFAALLSRRDTLAGGVLGFAAMFKLAPGIYLLYFVLIRRWRALAAMAAVSAVLLAISVVITGWATHVRFIALLPHMGYGHSVWEEYGAAFWKDPWNQSINSLLTHIMVSGNNTTSSWFAASQQSANLLTTLLSLLLIIFFVCCACPRKNANSHSDGISSAEQGAYMGILVLSLMLPSLMWDHYLMLLILPASWLANYYLSRKRWPSLATLFVFYAAAALPWRYDSPMFLSGWGVPLMTMKLFPVIGILIMCCIAAKTENACRPQALEGTNETN